MESVKIDLNQVPYERMSKAISYLLASIEKQPREVCTINEVINRTK